MRLRRRRSSDSNLVETRPDHPDDYIDADALLETLSVEELADSADKYFSRLENWDPLLAKPLHSVHDAPDMLMMFGTLLSGLELSHGLTVLDFGVGSGWTSWMMSQLGCRVIASDVSATALRITDERYRRMPLVGTAPQPELMCLDGHRLALDDESVDRVASFDAFHHAPNPQQVLAEFARILRPGGLCLLSEPGPEHSTFPQSQAEMRHFGVVERNIVVEEIVAQAQAVGFESLEVGIYSGLPQFVDAAAFPAVINGKSSLPSDQVRSFLHNHRLLRLRKPGTATADSRERRALAGSLRVAITDRTVHATVENTGAGVWLQSPGSVGDVNLGAHLFAQNGTLVDYDFMRVRLRSNGEPIHPGTTVEVAAPLPHLDPGEYRAEFDLVAESIAWFADNGGPTVTIHISG